MIVDVTATDPKRDWSYLSEGGATMVFSYVGPSHPTYDGKVLRLRKSLRQNSPRHAHLTLVDGSEDEANDLAIAFQEVVTSCLIPKANLPMLQTARVGLSWLKVLEGVTEARRSVTRIDKDSIDIYKRTAVLATDLVGGCGLAVEIKPKWGFLPSPKYLSPSTRELKLRHCRFCMHSHLKGKFRNSIVSSYCPLDLFSGNEARVRKALKNLWDTWVESQGSANNLRLFVDGQLVDPGDSPSLSRLMTRLKTSNPSNASVSYLESFIEAVLPLILGSSLFSTLARLQRAFDYLDIEGLSQLWSRFHPGLPLGKDEPEPTIAEWDTFIRVYLSGGDESLRYVILAYLLSATLKDCSVILRPNYMNMTGWAADTLTVIDLDPKSISRLSGWETLDRQIVKNFAEIAEEHRLCQL